jgi:hypothetical protein
MSIHFFVFSEKSFRHKKAPRFGRLFRCGGCGCGEAAGKLFRLLFFEFAQAVFVIDQDAVLPVVDFVLLYEQLYRRLNAAQVVLHLPKLALGRVLRVKPEQRKHAERGYYAPCNGQPAVSVVWVNGQHFYFSVRFRTVFARASETPNFAACWAIFRLTAFEAS